MKVHVLYEDNHLLMVQKPVNIPVQADKSGDSDLLTVLKEDLKVRYQKPGNVYLGLVHRLDRPVGGAMVFAKTSKAASRLSDMFRRRVVERSYLSVVHGVPKQKKGQLVHYLHKDKRENKVFVDPKHPKAKKAVLDYEVLESRNNFSLLAVKLHTGRPHQIRVQLSSIGHPIFGDQKYGQHVNKPGQQIALWADVLSFDHPIKKEPIEVYSLPPMGHPWNIWSHLRVRQTMPFNTLKASEISS